MALLAAVAVGLFPALASGDHPGRGGRPFATFMTGDQEVPGPGHPEATGTAYLRLNPGQQEVYFVLYFEGIDPDDPNDLITAGHIHYGPAGEAGPIVVDFMIDGPIPVNEYGEGYYAATVHGDRRVLQEIIRNPEYYYVNLHSPNFPPGAIRGQLGRANVR